MMKTNLFLFSILICLIIAGPAVADNEKHILNADVGYFDPDESHLDFESDFQFGIEYEYQFSENGGIILGYLRSSLETKSSYSNTLTYKDTGPLSGDFSAILLAGKYTFSSDKRWKPYLMVGICQSKLEISGSVSANADDVGLYAGLGVSAKLTRKVFLNFQADLRTGKYEDIKIGGKNLGLKIGYQF